MPLPDYFVHIGLPKCASSAVQSYFARNARRLDELGVRYPLDHTNAQTPKHQYLIQDFQKGEFCPTKFGSEIAREHCIVLSTEGLTNHLYDFPTQGLASAKDFFSKKNAVGIMIVRDPVAWCRSYYIQCTLNPRTPSSPHYASSSTLEEFSSLPQVTRLLDFGKLAQDAKTAYGFSSLHILNQSEDILDQLHELGIPKIDGAELQRENSSPGGHLIEIIRQINGLTKDNAVRGFCLSLLQDWAQTSNNVMSFYKDGCYPVDAYANAMTCFDQLIEFGEGEFFVSQEIINDLRRFANEYPHSSLERFELSSSDESALEAEVGPPGFWRQTQAFQFKFLMSKGLRPAHNLLDIGCGTLRGGLPIIDYLEGGKYTGIDVRADVIDRAKSLLRNFDMTSKGAQLARCDKFGRSIVPAVSQDYIFAFQVLYHLSDDLVEPCLRACSDLMVPDGKVYANVHCENLGNASKWKEFPFVPRPLDYYKSVADKVGLRMKNLGRMSDLGYPMELGGHLNHMLEFSSI